jgi:hypothetical protein
LHPKNILAEQCLLIRGNSENGLRSKKPHHTYRVEEPFMPDSIAIDCKPAFAAGASVKMAPGNFGPVAAIAHCILAKRGAHKKALAERKDKSDALRAGNFAFLRAMPPLSGLNNIRNFIACVAHAMVTEVLLPADAAPLLAAARTALHPVSHNTELSMPGAA